MARRRGWGGNPPDNDEDASRRIVEAAVELIGRTSSEISIGDVAESLGVIRQTVYRYFPSADALMRAAAIASVDGYLDRLTTHVSGIEDPVEAMTEGVLYTLTQVHRTPHLGILLTSTNSSLHPEGLTSQEAQAFGMAMINRFDVDWVHYGYDDASLQELVEYVLRTMQSFFLAPGDPPRSDEELRRYLRRWMGSAIIAQANSVSDDSISAGLSSKQRH
ncbi:MULTISPECIES: TetR/AcrR family transcriptional regulator [Rhodococcus]|uniref:TetR/AcrR family transcriptional regulator n=1 Tax=Rhodococcus TaxID=1827 RepID=UPI00061B7E23|nr:MULTISPECIES: TetR/AcrR family transcriptional regulator [Rhodococcus]AKD97472.1 TetR family transcriptional regulator [Rhodococcus erythropolis]MCQ4127313.1 TetR/AcrR family transcriptional regulator [Rhodococcus erythropolis]MCZ4566728.1 TetR/AcrR family transcriptional regulator [Rhodococcus erythropolis]MDI9906362.1 TetR/AcrR family transcriptional regulator [Rhodococcus sp. IEGM 1406]MDJ0012782.1 TetR/AcrR family transcriptional regulator [Rhodococcus erythropolis]